MKIRLHEIPEEGREYIINRNTAELNQVLQDLISQAPYQVSLHIKPINSKDFEMTGSVMTSTDEDCSRCGEDFAFNIQKKIHEILIPFQEDDRTSKYAKSSTPISESEEWLSVSTYKASQFDLGEFIHEAVALEIPLNPAPSCQADGNCSVCQKPALHTTFVYDEKMGEEEQRNPFLALKDIKLN